jgi:hypothetical protein
MALIDLNKISRFPRLLQELAARISWLNFNFAEDPLRNKRRPAFDRWLYRHLPSRFRLIEKRFAAGETLYVTGQGITDAAQMQKAREAVMQHLEARKRFKADALARENADSNKDGVVDFQEFETSVRAIEKTLRLAESQALAGGVLPNTRVLIKKHSGHDDFLVSNLDKAGMLSQLGYAGALYLIGAAVALGGAIAAVAAVLKD